MPAAYVARWIRCSPPRWSSLAIVWFGNPRASSRVLLTTPCWRAASAAVPDHVATSEGGIRSGTHHVEAWQCKRYSFRHALDQLCTKRAANRGDPERRVD